MSTQIRTVADLDRLQGRLKLSPELAARIAAKVAPALSALAQQSYDAQRSPYGDAWTGKDGALDLKESGALRRKALQFRANGRRVRASIGAVPWARFLIKYGILPRGGRSMPAAWIAKVNEIAEQEIAAYFRGAR